MIEFSSSTLPWINRLFRSHSCLKNAFEFIFHGFFFWTPLWKTKVIILNPRRNYQLITPTRKQCNYTNAEQRKRELLARYWNKKAIQNLLSSTDFEHKFREIARIRSPRRNASFLFFEEKLFKRQRWFRVFLTLSPTELGQSSALTRSY